MDEESTKSGSFMVRLSTLIVDKRNLIFLLIGIALVFALVGQSLVKVENDLAEYLPTDSNTRKGMDLMEEQFTTFGTANLMISNITLDKALEIGQEIEDTPGVQGVKYCKDDSDEDDDSSDSDFVLTDYYNHSSALYEITFDYDEDDPRSLEMLEELEARYADYDCFVKTTLGDTDAEMLAKEINVIMVYVTIVVLTVLLFTSQTYAEIPVLIITFVVAMLLNNGTNFIFGKISFISNSVTSILQLALSLDYAVILCNRFKEEHQTMEVREAAIAALSKAIPEISSSSLTTIGGLVAMMFMKFRIGPDMGICLIKSILYALFSVFVLMPGLLVMFGPLMDKTKHRNFVPKIPFVGKFAYATRRVIPLVFVVLVVAAYMISNKCSYAYGVEAVPAPKTNEVQLAKSLIKENFEDNNLMAVLVPTGDYARERAILDELEAMPQVKETLGLANAEAMDGYMLGDELKPRQFAELADIDYEVALLVYAAYANDKEDYGRIVGGISDYKVPLIDMFLFLCDEMDEGYVSFDDETEDDLHDAQTTMTNARLQLQGSEYSRMLVYLDMPQSSQETYDFLGVIEATAQKYYPGQTVYAVGQSSSELEFERAFGRDNLVVSVMSILIVLVVLLFTFNSAGMPILLIVVIQGAIWINFSFPVMMGSQVFFLSYLVVSSIQMGANIDYAIVISNRYMELKNEMSERDAIIETMNFAFPTIIVSGAILALCGILIGQNTSNGAIVGIGQCLGRGTVLSLILVMFVLPQILLLGSRVIERTSFATPQFIKKREKRGRIRVDGRVRGQISGSVNGVIHAVVEGDVNLSMVTGTVKEESEGEE